MLPPLGPQPAATNHLLDGKIRDDPGAVEASDGQAARPSHRGIAGRGRLSGGQYQLCRSGGVLSQTHRTRPPVREPPEGFGVPSAHGSAVGIRLPRRNDDGDKLSSKQANFKGKPYNGAAPGPSLNRAAKVGSYPANAWGLHDMHGNIFAWYRDWYHVKLPGGVDPDLYSALTTAAVNRTGDTSRSRRGGAWTDDGWPCRSASRLRFEPARRYDHIGFRVLAVRP
ncbi:MAG: hypothetical protein EXS30_03285 [Pedosphaera sp.]|nr:hypothetical protein [Pedosphaera sp.]